MSVADVLREMADDRGKTLAYYERMKADGRRSWLDDLPGRIQRERRWSDALTRAAGLLDVLPSLVDPDPCHYDRNGRCQAHLLHLRPCPHERAKSLLTPVAPVSSPSEDSPR